MAADPKRIEAAAFIGLGRMGLPMAANLARKGLRVVGYDLDESVGAEARSRGIEMAADIAAAVDRVDVVLTMLPGSKDVESVLAGPGGVLSHVRPETLIVDTSTIDPDTSRALASLAAGKGLDFVDAPVSRGRAAAVSGELTFMVGGTQAAFERAKPVLSLMGTLIYRMGPVGCGGVAKLVNNYLVGVNIAAVSEGLILAEKAGLDVEQVANLIQHSSGSSFVLDHFFGDVITGSDPAPNFSVDLLHKDLGLAIGMGIRHTSATTVGAAALGLIGLAKSMGHGRDDMTMLYRLLRQVCASQAGAVREEKKTPVAQNAGKA